jgi:hypothetical protein
MSEGLQQITFDVTAGNLEELRDRALSKLKSFVQPTRGEWLDDWHIDWSAEEILRTDSDGEIELVEARVTAQRRFP